ncbi:transcriptional regulator, LysR family protein [Roseibacterium elongatum DSM 19469]|uniref:Transcriptional regulator, LysR family protein n=1 Tax=Roseicyclus elongatus DSM 19469 TaxID=1294273 RepID=W8SRC2_9RHOB|nr:LysR family transcriptional regulator [Roseibacterium elongatum]AHM05075.1 transcriptional regulator, LysR family protein [Roseibacterium elongatum DSM 19469]
MSLAPRRPRLPPLNALRAFEAAMRLGGFAQAAEELGVTPAAVSQHIKTLEGWAGAALFDRHARGVCPTATARRLAPALSGAFDQIAAALTDLREAHPRPTLQIAALPSVAQIWLGPRLPALRTALPGVEIAVHAIETPPDLNREMFDLSIFFRPDATGDHPLQRDALCPVCAPALAERLTRPEDLDHVVLLHDEVWASDWATWAEGAGVALPSAPSNARYSLYSMALAEAMAGAGVLIGHMPLVADALASGALVRPFAAIVDTGQVLSVDQRRGSRRAAQAFKVLREAL